MVEKKGVEVEKKGVEVEKKGVSIMRNIFYNNQSPQEHSYPMCVNNNRYLYYKVV